MAMRRHLKSETKLFSQISIIINYLLNVPYNIEQLLNEVE